MRRIFCYFVFSLLVASTALNAMPPKPAGALLHKMLRSHPTGAPEAKRHRISPDLHTEKFEKVVKAGSSLDDHKDGADASENTTSASASASSSPSDHRMIDGPTTSLQIQQIFTCPYVGRLSRRDISERSRYPSYASHLSQWVLERRLARLSPEEHSAWADRLKERFSYEDIWLSTTSDRIFDRDSYRFVVNHVSLSTDQYYNICFEVFAIDNPLDLWLEGRLTAGHLRFEDGLSIRDAHILRPFFQILSSRMIPSDVLETHFADEAVPEEKKTPHFENLVTKILEEDALKEELFDQMEFIPMVP